MIYPLDYEDYSRHLSDEEWREIAQDIEDDYWTEYYKSNPECLQD